MKILLLSMLLSVLALSGCARTYVLTLSNGSKITAMGKPKLEGHNYVFKDVAGVETSIPSFRVAEIAPSSMASEDKSDSNFRFNRSQ
jgi:hypothetical protein